MDSFWETPFIVVDVETTGSHAAKNRVTDIACVTVTGSEIVSEYHSLVNPHQFIPGFIVNMTGITNEMASLAPEPEEVFREIRNILSMPGAVFVAHNAVFDWSFVRESFKRAGYEPPDMPRLCSLKLARRLLPHSVKKGVGNLAKYFSIGIKNRHRAYGDARATAEILIELLDRAEQEHDIVTLKKLLKFQNKPVKNFQQPCKSYDKIEPQLKKLPDQPGVYYFYNGKKQLLYIGKAKSLKTRVRSYFNDKSITSGKIVELVKRIRKIEWQGTGSELAALLLESKEIKRHSPPYNSAQKRYKQFPFIKLAVNEIFPRPEMCFTIEPDGAEYYGPFRSPALVRDILKIIERQFLLRNCEGSIKPDKENRPCFYFQIGRCLSPCSGKAGPENYFAELDKVKNFLSGFSEGIVHSLEEKMYQFSDEMKFEEAGYLRNRIEELRRIFNRSQHVPTSVNENNVILVLPASKKEKSLELFFIRSGRLIRQELINGRLSLSKLNKSIKKIYFNGSTNPIFYSLEEIDELRIISSWVYSKRSEGNFVYLDAKSPNQVSKEVEYALKHISFE